jgi:peptide chain release factor 2
MSEPGFWDDHERAQAVIQEVKKLRETVAPLDRIGGRVRSLQELEELLELEPDPSMEAEIDRELDELDEELPAFELRAMLNGPDDHRGAMVEISAGAGGTEAQDWASMILRMYTRWAERRGYSIEVLDMSEGEEAGIKGAMVVIEGE